VANRNKGRGGRSRKRRPSTARAGAGGAATREAPAAGEGETAGHKGSQAQPRSSKRVRPRGAAERGGGAFRDPMSVGERPQAPWHPLPLSELLIMVGAIGTVFGLRRLNHGISHAGPALFAGLAAVLIGTVEVTLREHLSGYRSHTLILTLLPVVVFHSAVVLIVATITPVPRLLNVGLLVLDAALFAFLFKLLRARFLDARRERTFAGGR
jgi:hypothetical protein